MAHKDVRVEIQFDLDDPDLLFLRQVMGPNVKPTELVRAMYRQGLVLERAKHNQFTQLNKEQKECLNPNHSPKSTTPASTSQ